LPNYSSELRQNYFFKQAAVEMPSLQSMGFQATESVFPSKNLQEEIVKKYTDQRNFPGIENGTSKLGVH
jgi:deoxyribodipyrimidine photo-lyase